MRKIFCDICDCELKEQQIVRTNKTWSNFELLEICDSCAKKLSDKISELSERTGVIREKFMKEIKKIEEEIFGDLK